VDELALVACAQAAVRPATRRAGRTWHHRPARRRAGQREATLRARWWGCLARGPHFRDRRAVSSYLEVKIQTPGGLRDRATGQDSEW